VDRWYPNRIMAGSIDDYLPRLSDPAYTTGLIQALGQLFAGRDRRLLRFAEFGVWKGATTGQLARFLDNEGELHLFNYDDTVAALKEKLEQAEFTNVTAWGSSYRYLDSYNWNLRQILEDHPHLRFDYIFLDGAHTWAIDALTFLLCDLLLRVGGYFHFNNYGWRLRGSSLDPERIPATAALYTGAQIDDCQVRAIVDLLVRRSGRYREVVRNCLFQKIAGADAIQNRMSADARNGETTASSSCPSFDLGTPHLFSGELEAMNRILRDGHRRYQEFGIGGSTVLAIRSGLESVVAVDSDPNWVDAARRHPEIAEAISAGRADIRHADIGPVAQWGHPSDPGHIRSWPGYIATAWDAWAQRNEMPDLIFVDGRFRVACCLSVALLAAADPGLTGVIRVLLHDVGPERPYYDEVLQFFDVVESVNTLRVMKIKPGVSGSRVMSVLLRRQFDQR
jgi:hypothetical protein